MTNFSRVRKPPAMLCSRDFNFDSIPDELKKSVRWVNWRMVERNGKFTKVPINPANGQPASCADSATWGTYEQAVERFKRGGADGIGFQLGAGCIGVDLDKCRDMKSGVVEHWANEIVSRLNSYTEISPSGEGLHIIAKGSLPPGRRRKGKVEMYCEGRFFTITGRYVEGTPSTIEERSLAIYALYREEFSEAKIDEKAARRVSNPSNSMCDRELIERACRAENGAKFARLWGGDCTGYSSQSEADLALCMMLAFWTEGDANRTDRLFRQSKLYRGKWDDRHDADGRSYGQITTDKAIERTAEQRKPTARRENSSPDVGLTKELADQILLSEHFAQDPGGRLYRFHAGVYKPDGGPHVKRLVKRFLEDWRRTKKWSSARSEEVVEYIRVDAPILWARPPLSVVNLANGLLNIEAGRLWPHSADHLSPVQLPVAFDPEATCPLWDRFVEDVFPTDAQHLPWQLVAWLMRPDVSVQKAVYCWEKVRTANRRF